MKLIHRNDLPQYRPSAYSSREALPWVEKALEGLHDIEGLQGLRDALLLNFDSEVFNAVESGEWLLLKPQAYAFDWAPYEKAAAEARARQAFMKSIEPVKVRKEGAPPGFHIVQRPMSRNDLQASFFHDPFSVRAKQFLTFNSHLGPQIKPGQLVILADPDDPLCYPEVAQLKQAAAIVDAALQDLTDEEASFMVQHHDAIESFLTHGSTAVGVGETVFAKHLKTMAGTLKDLENLHQRTYQQHGHLRTSEFFAERKRLLSQLDNSLTPLVRKSIGLPDHPKLKTALGISSRSLIHHWDKAGAPGQIPGYATHIDGVSKAAKYVKAGGVVGIGIGATASVLNVQETCRVGREEECRKVKFTEGGKFTGVFLGGWAGGKAGLKVAAVLCPAFIPAGGIGGLACGIAIVGAGSIAGGFAGDEFGSDIGELIYKKTE